MFIKETTKHHARDIKHLERIKKGKEQRKKRVERKKSGLPAGIPQTLETLRLPDETVVSKDDKDVLAEEVRDEFTDIYNGSKTPKMVITYSDRACPATMGFCKELTKIIPNSMMWPRYHMPLKKMLKKAIENDCTALIILNEDAKKINTLVVTYLPDGPTVTYKVSNLKSIRDFKVNKGKDGVLERDVIPQFLCMRFMTRLGRRVQRCLGALFPIDSHKSVPDGHNRTVVFHNQRDFIFFRHYRYLHKKPADEDGQGPSKERVAMQEVGPRFTLKLKSIQVGTFDSKFADFEWVRKRHDINRSRRNFVL